MPVNAIAPSISAQQDASAFLDNLKAAGVVITNEEILRNHIVDDVEHQTDLSEFFYLGIRNPLLKIVYKARLYCRRTSELTVETSYATIIFKIGMEC